MSLEIRKLRSRTFETRCWLFLLLSRHIQRTVDLDSEIRIRYVCSGASQALRASSVAKVVQTRKMLYCFFFQGQIAGVQGQPSSRLSPSLNTAHRRHLGVVLIITG